MEERRNIWLSSEEAQDMVIRNTIEYEYEGRDWRNVVEEHDFVSIGQDGTIHPAHVWRMVLLEQQRLLMQLQRPPVSSIQSQFCRILLAQQQQQQQQQQRHTARTSLF
jgi:hypothetical protein